MAKYHINDAGEVGTCKAQIKDCKFASSEGGGDGHYADKQEAQEAATKKMEAQYKDVYKGYRRGEETGMNMPDAMKRRLIEEGTQEGARVSAATIGRVLSKDNDELIRKAVVEKLSSQKLLRDMSDDESARVRKAVAMRTNNREVLAKLTNDPDRSVQLAAIKNEKTPAKARKAAQDAIKAANLKNLEKARAKANSSDTSSKESIDADSKKQAEEPLSREQMIEANRRANSEKRLKAKRNIRITEPKGAKVVKENTNKAEEPQPQFKREILTEFEKRPANDPKGRMQKVFHDSSEKAKLTKEIAAFEGVETKNVRFNSPTRQIAVIKGENASIYDRHGNTIGKMPKDVYEKVSKIQTDLYRIQNSIGSASKESQGGLSSKSHLYPLFKNAHDPSASSKKGADGSYTESPNVTISRTGKEGTPHLISVGAPDGYTYKYNSKNLTFRGVEKTK